MPDRTTDGPLTCASFLSWADPEAEIAASLKERAELAKERARLAEREARFYADREQHFRELLSAVRAMNAHNPGGRLFVLDAECDQQGYGIQYGGEHDQRAIDLTEYHIAVKKTATGALICTLGFCTQDGAYGQITFGESTESSDDEQPALCCQYTVKGDTLPGTLSDESGCFRELLAQLQKEDSGLPLTLDDGNFITCGPLILLIERCIEALNGRTYVKADRPAHLSQFLEQLAHEHRQLIASNALDQRLPDHWVDALGEMTNFFKDLVLHGLRFQVSVGLIDLMTINPRVPEGESDASNRLLPKLLPHILQLLEPACLLRLLFTVHIQTPEFIRAMFLTDAALKHYIFQQLLTNPLLPQRLRDQHLSEDEKYRILKETLDLVQAIATQVEQASSSNAPLGSASDVIGIPLSSTPPTLFSAHRSIDSTNTADSHIPRIISLD